MLNLDEQTILFVLYNNFPDLTYLMKSSLP